MAIQYFVLPHPYKPITGLLHAAAGPSLSMHAQGASPSCRGGHPINPSMLCSSVAGRYNMDTYGAVSCRQ